jgi:hypothetical protein
MKPGLNTEGKEKISPLETATFRIEHDILDELREESKHKMESLNLLINKLLKLYVGWLGTSLT